MGRTYYKKQADNTQDTLVTENTPLPVRAYQGDGEEERQDVRIVNSTMPPVAGVSIDRRVIVPGVGTGSAYAAGDAFGTLIIIPGVFRTNVNSGWLSKVVFFDKDDEGIQKDVHILRAPMTTTADNDAYAPSDDDLMQGKNAISITTFFNWGNNQFGAWNGSVSVRSDDTNLYLRLITQGADNIAAGSVPWIEVTVIPD